MSTPIEGRRLADTVEGRFPVVYSDLRPGDYWKVLDPHTKKPKEVSVSSNLTKEVWFVVAPGPKSDQRMLANLTQHTVREHEDGTISVRPGDGSSNSILVERRPGERWHGYIEHGVWTEC